MRMNTQQPTAGRANKNGSCCIFMFMSIIDSLCRNRLLRQRIAHSRQRLFRMAVAWSGDLMVADDLVQEAQETALHKLHQLRDPERVDAWLYSILHNAWRQHLRRRQPDTELDQEQPAEGDTPEQTLDRLQLVEQVRRAIAALPVAQREVVTLVDLEGFSYAEVAEILEIPMGTVMSRLNRARGGLRQRLRRCGSEGARPEPARVRRVK